MVVVTVLADLAVLFVDRLTGNVLDCVYLTLEHTDLYDHIQSFNPLHPALLMAEEWDEIPLHVLQHQVRAVA